MPPVPDPPDQESLDDHEFLVEYVADYEKAYQWNEWSDYGSSYHKFNVDTNLEVVNSRSNGAMIRSDYAHVTGRVDHQGDGTAGHFDGPEYVVSYLVTTDAVWRADAIRRNGEPVPDPDPRQKGQVLECFDGEE